MAEYRRSGEQIQNSGIVGGFSLGNQEGGGPTESPSPPPSAPGKLPFEDVTPTERVARGARSGASARSGRRNRQREATMGGHPSQAQIPLRTAADIGMTGGHGQQKSRYGQPGPSTGYGPGGAPAAGPTPGPRPNVPYGNVPVGHEFEKPPAPAAPYATGSTFALRGKGKYYNPRNVSGSQFNTPAVVGAIRNGLERHTEAGYFRTAGMGAALRYTFGMKQLPSHVNDYIVARHNQATRGIKPKGLDQEWE